MKKTYTVHFPEIGKTHVFVGHGPIYVYEGDPTEGKHVFRPDKASLQSAAPEKI